MTSSFEIELNPTSSTSINNFWENFREITHGEEIIVTGLKGRDLSQLLEDDRKLTFGVEPKNIQTAHYLNVYNPLFYAVTGFRSTALDSGFRGLFLYDSNQMSPLGSTSVLWRHSQDSSVNNALNGIIEIKLEN
jgi:hypothetical protein